MSAKGDKGGSRGALPSWTRQPRAQGNTRGRTVPTQGSYERCRVKSGKRRRRVLDRLTYLEETASRSTDESFRAHTLNGRYGWARGQSEGGVGKSKRRTTHREEEEAAASAIGSDG